MSTVMPSGESGGSKNVAKCEFVFKLKRKKTKKQQPLDISACSVYLVHGPTFVARWEEWDDWAFASV